MSGSPELKDRKALVQEWIQRFTTYTDRVTWFGLNSVAKAVAEACGGLAHYCVLLFIGLVRRFTVMAGSGDTLRQVATDRGVRPLSAVQAKVMVIFVPEGANVSAIVNAGANDDITVDDASPFQAGDSIRIRNGVGSVTETRTIGAVAGNVITVPALAGVYNPAGEDVDILFRATIPKETEIETSVGVRFQTLEQVITGDANPVLDGEGTALSLADKVWCECTTREASGNIDPKTVTGLVTPIRGVKDVYNPERGTGGADDEGDFDLKYRTMQTPTGWNQETLAWLERMAAAANSNVLRALTTTASAIGTLAIKVLHRNGGTFTSAQLKEIGQYIADRVRSYMAVEVQNVTLTAVEVEAEITLEADANLEEVWRAASSALATFLDWRKWKQGEDVDPSDLFDLVKNTAGVATVELASFLPAVAVAVGDESFPTLTRVSLLDVDSGDTINAELAQSF